MKIFLISFYMVLLLLNVNKISVNGTIKLSSNKRFDDVLIYISDNVPEGDGKTLHNIQVLITKASKNLFKATSTMTKGKDGISFGEIYIRVPMSWKINAEPITWQQCVKSEIQIVTKEMNGNNNKPYTKQINNCGDPGEYTRFSDFYFQEDGTDKMHVKGKEIMTEFLKLRYGVFSEEPYQNVLYEFDGQNFIQSSCPHNVKWKTTKNEVECSDRGNGCQYSIYPTQSHNYSVMFDFTSPTSEYICNDDTMPHNAKAYTLQNLKCNGASVSSVILKHSDFLHAGDAIGEVKYYDPVFHIVKAVARKIVLLLDTSGSMHPMINATKKALKYFITYTIEDNAEIGIVVFSKKAYIISKLVSINSTTKISLLNKIDKLKVWGPTNMGDGLLKAVEVLGGNIRSSDKLYGTIILLSDGENNENTTIDYKQAIINIIPKGVVTYTISYGNISDPDLNKLAKETGGMFLYASSTSSESELFTKFTVQKSCDISTQNQVKAMEGKIIINSKSSLVNFTYLDKFIGQNTVIYVDLEGGISKTIVQLIDPLGMPFESSERSTNKNITTIIFKIPGKAVVGMYKLKLIPIREKRYKRSVFSLPIKFQISAKGSSYTAGGSLSTTVIDVVNETSYVRSTVDLSNIEKKNFEEVKVSITMKYPNGNTVVLKLTDDGSGDDSIDGDGIYSRTIYARSFTQIGFYQFQGQIQLLDNSNGVSIIRTIEMESIRVHNLNKTTIADIVSPSSIQGVDIVYKEKNQKKIIILFIAPGDDGMTGRINLYEVKVLVKEKINLMTFTEYANPFEYLSLNLYLNFFDLDDFFQLSVRGIDSVGNCGIWSKPTLVHW